MASITKAVFAILVYIHITSAQFDHQYHLDQQVHFQQVQDVIRKQEQMQQLTQQSYERQNNQQLQEFKDILQNRPTVQDNQRHDLMPQNISPVQTQRQVLHPIQQLHQAEQQYQQTPRPLLHTTQQSQQTPMPLLHTTQQYQQTPQVLHQNLQYKQTQRQVFQPLQKLQQAEHQILQVVQQSQQSSQVLPPNQQYQQPQRQVLHPAQQLQQAEQQILQPVQKSQQVLHTVQQNPQSLQPVQHYQQSPQVLQPVQKYEQGPRNVIDQNQQYQHSPGQVILPVQQHQHTPRQINQQFFNFGASKDDELDDETDENFDQQNEHIPRILDFLMPQEGKDTAKTFQDAWQIGQIGQLGQFGQLGQTSALTSPIFDFLKVQKDDELDDDTESKPEYPRIKPLEPTRQQNLQLYRQLKPINQENKLFDQDRQYQNQNLYQVTPDVAQYFRRCRYSASDFDSCMIKILNQLNFLFPTGAPEYDIPPFDPFFASEVETSQNGPLMSFTLKLTDVSESGWTMSTVTGFKSDLKRRRVTLKQTWPDKRLAGGYIIEGKIFGQIAFRNKGKFNLTLLGFNQTTQLTRPLGEYDEEGSPITKCQVSIQGVDNLRLHITNLLYGARAFEYVLDGIINATWRPFYPLTKPLVNELVSKAFTKIFTRAFRRVPFEYFFIA